MADNEKVPAQVTRELAERQLMAWRNSLEDLRIQFSVAEAIGDGEERKDFIRRESMRCVKAVEHLTKIIDELA